MPLINSAVQGAKVAGSLGKRAIPALAFAGGAVDYQEERKKGKGMLYSAGHAAVTTWAQWTFWAPMLALQVAPLAGQVTRAIRESVGEQQRQTMPLSPYRFKDSEYAQSARRQALEAIQQSRGRASGYLGREAGLFATRYR